ncbi:hypothetical protein APHCRT_0216 [Anaplasma phagocytophilum str. CRT53-1]|uniref:Uncharacterized protein n=1 Tax=Anaplasma phagocytophilum str. CRT53-1 TaxID=1359157 RepID=A0A0F3Q642_ANAPH|nr:hypothetical protein APHCRT_1655 [Anaplasma phagocytophilum str. CRT53-1]KJV88060.1 hypothetical protein APHCRT_0216 [Anaplasma phagocytophilum str. CRT53-1]
MPRVTNVIGMVPTDIIMMSMRLAISLLKGFASTKDSMA